MQELIAHGYVTVVNFPLCSYNYCFYSTRVDRHLVNKAKANYELVGKSTDIVIQKIT
jgi:hypothetical protein